MMLNISQKEKVIESIYIRVLNLFYPLVFCLLLKLQKDRLSFDERLEVGDFF